MEKEKREITERVKKDSISEEELKEVSGGYFCVMYSHKCLECGWFSGLEEDKSAVDARRDAHSEQNQHYNFECYRDTGVWV